MSDAWSAVAGSLQRFGGAVGEYGETIIKMDAAAKRDAAQVAIIKQIEDFKRGLITDPDYGTPEVVTGERAGYMKKFDALMDQAARSAEGIDNHVARQEVQSFLERTKASQESAVAQLQFQKWGQNTLASRMQAIREYNDASTDSPDAKIAHTYASLTDLLQYNVIGQDQATEILAGETQQIMRNTLLEQAKEAYKEGNLPAAMAVIAANTTTVSTPVGNFGASDAIKKLAQADLAQYHAVVQEQENSRMIDAYSNSMNFYLGRGDAQKPVLTIDMIMKSDLDAAGKEHWVDKLRTLDNYMTSGAGSKENGNVAALYGSMYQWAYEIGKTIGTTTSGSRFQLTLPDGKQRTVSLDPEEFEATLRDLMPIIAMTGKQDDFIKLRDMFEGKNGKSPGIFADMDKALDDTAKAQKWPPALLLQTRSAAEAWKRQNPTATADQVTKYIEANFKNKMVDINVARAWDYNINGQGNEEKIGLMIANGTAALYMADKGNGIFDVESPLFKETYRQYKAAVEREVKATPGAGILEIGRNAIGRATAEGEYWISTMDQTTILQLGISNPRAPADQQPIAVSFTTRLFGADRSMQRFREIELPQKKFRHETFLDGIGWVGVQQFTAPDGIKYWDVPLAERKSIYGKIDEAVEKRRLELLRTQGSAATGGAASRYLQMAQPGE